MIKLILKRHISYKIHETNVDALYLRQAIKQQLLPVVSYLRNPRPYDARNISPNSVLLSGPPGTGKFTLAKALAQQAKVPFIPISRTVPVQYSLKQIQHLSSPCVICFDALETLSYQQSQLLALCIEKKSGIVVTATTDTNQLDPILTKKFEHTIVLELPKLNEREEILAIHTHNQPLAPTVNLHHLAKLSHNFSPAQLAAWVKHAALNSIIQRQSTLSEANFVDTYVFAIEGAAPQYQDNSELRLMIAIHEAGHALIAHHVGRSPTYISTIKSHLYYGKTVFAHREPYLVEDVLDRICIDLGGLTAERLFGLYSIGASSDLRNAVTLALTLLKSQFETATAHHQDDVKPILIAQRQRACTILNDNKAVLEQVIINLHKHHYLTESEFLAVLAGEVIQRKNTPYTSSLSMFTPPKARQPNPENPSPLGSGLY